MSSNTRTPNGESPNDSTPEREQSPSQRELSRLLPLLPDADADEVVRVKALLAVASAEEQALAEAFEADALALEAYAKTQAGDHPMLVGFADSVMAQIALAPQVSQTEPPRVGGGDEERRSTPILRPVFGTARYLMAFAALFLGGLGLAILFSAEEIGTSPAPITAGVTDAPPTDEPVASGSTTPDASPEGGVEFVAPARPGARRARRAPRGRRGIVPVDGRGGAQNGHPLLEALMQGWQPPTRVPPLPKGEREVKF